MSYKHAFSCAIGVYKLFVKIVIQKGITVSTRQTAYSVNGVRTIGK